jgi:putative ABC transport system permease protein
VKNFSALQGVDMRALIQDLLYGLRILRNSPGFTMIAVLTLALGVGVNVAIFSFVDELWLRPMPVPQADRLVRIFTSSPTSHGETERGLNSYLDFEDLRAAKTLSGVALLERRGAMYDDGSQNRLVTAAVLSDNFFEVLQPAPAYGRTFTERELRDSAARPIVISYPFWRRAFNSDPDIVGRSIVLNRQSVLVLSVLPRGFRGTEAFMVPDVWIPYSTWTQMNPGDRHRQTDRGFRDFELFGRLSDRTTLQQARAELSSIAGQLAQAYPKTNAGRRMSAVIEPDARGEGIAGLGLVLLGVAGLVLLIACANVASLLIARGESRRREIATRIALGGSRARIVRQLLTETIILAVAGGAAALLLGNLALQALPSLMPQTSIPVGVDAFLSRRGIVVAAGTVVLSLFFFALIPALLATRLAPVAGLRLRGSEGGKLRAFTRSALVIGQVALSLVLVVSAGLLVRSLWNGLKLDPGFNAHQSMLVVDFSPDLNRDESVRLTEELQRRIEALPGVTGTTVALRVPFGLSGGGMTHKVFLAQTTGDGREGATINYAPVAGRYFEILGTRILRGRAIDRHDVETHARVLVVNQQMAARFWPNQDPVGQLLRLDKPAGEEYEVIGVAENGKYNDIQEDTMPYLFLPMTPVDYGEVEMAIRTSSDPAALAAPFRQALRALNPNAPIVELITLRDHMREALYIQSATSRLIGTLGVLGLVLVAVGIYGLMSFVVGKRTQEIGVRLALGSQRSAIFRLILHYALRLGAVGTAIGVVASVAAGWALRSLLVGVAPSDPIVLVLGGAVLLSMAVVAALVPAMKAVRVDPVVALRDE